MYYGRGITGIVLWLLITPAFANGLVQEIPMQLKDASSFYITGVIPGTAPSAFMVDTGSSYMTINAETLETLQAIDGVEYKRNIVGVLASGEERRVPIYRIAALLLGDHCLLHDVEVAVFPGKTRQILGLNVLRRTSPFRFSVDPPSLRLSNCEQQLSRQEFPE